MAKHCDVCNQDYADELAACPHCAEAKKTHLAGRGEDRTTQLAQQPRPDRLPSDGAIDLGQAPHAPGSGEAAGAPPSDVSDVAWAALVEEPADEVQIDAPSDADLLQHGTAGKAPGGARSPSESAVDLGAIPGGKGSSAGSAPSGSVVFMAELASDASKVDYVRDSGVQIGEGAKQKGPPAPSEPPAAEHEPSIEAVEPGPAQESPEAELTEKADLDVVSAGDDSSAVDLGAPPANVDLVEAEEAEPVEVRGDSGVSLEGLDVPSPSGSGSNIPSDSAVDLGSRPEIVTDEWGSEAVAESAALEALESEPPTSEPTVEEPAVSEAEVNELLNNLEETPANETDPADVDAAEGEAAVAAAEEELAAQEEQAAAEEEEKPAQPPRPRSNVPALVGSTILGILVGAGGLIGARFAGVDVPALVGAGGKEKPVSQPIAPVVQQPPQPQTPSFESRAEMVRRGDWEQAAKGIDQIDENKPEEVATRGDLRFHAYLAKAGSKIDFQDATLQLAVADLSKAAAAKNPDALYDLGLLNELANKLPEARAEYAKGLQEFQNDPIQKRRFQAALHRVDLKSSGAARGAFGPLPERNEDRAMLLALLLIALQEPQPAQPQPAQPQAGTEEAGFEFWEAAKLAREGKFADARKMIDRAKSLHDQRRFTRLRKSQNPLSDPTEEIFLRCCEELKNYWALESQLREGGYLTDKNTPVDALQDALKKADAGGSAVKALADKLIMEKVITRPEDMAKGIERLIAEKKDAEGKAAELTMQLKKNKDEATALSSKLKMTEEAVKEREDKLRTAAEREMKLKAANDDLNSTLKKVTDELTAAKLLDPTDKPDVRAAVHKVIEVAKTTDAQGILRKQRGEIDRLTAALKLRRRPEEILPLWLLVLEQNRTRTDLATKAEQDAERLKADGQATAAQKGQAQIVLGLALRNKEKFAEARAALEAGRAAVDRGAWLTAADAALKEVSDPAAYYARQAESLYNHGRMDEALALLDRASGLPPAKEQGRFLARRSLIELDAATSKAKGMVSPADPLLAAARRDAEASIKSGAAEGHYAAGRIAEELGQTDEAAKSYRQAMAAHSALDAEGSRYRIALARVLSLPRDVRPAPAARKVSWSDPAPYPARYHIDAKFLVLAALFGLQAPGLADDQAGSEEAERLADEILKAPADKMPFDVRAQALAVKGRWTLALQTYVEGVRALVPREYGNGLMYLVRNHPRLKRPDSLRVPNPMEAEKHFAAGLNFYFERDYTNAEKEFLLTVENDSSDARYYYFLGLSRLAQNKRRDANDDFDQGAALERLNRPSPAAVSESLERIQGPARRIVNDVRDRPVR